MKQIIQTLTRRSLILLVPLLLMACAHQVPTHSGFLADYSTLRPQEAESGLQTIVVSEERHWNKVHIEPVRFINPDPDQAIPNAEQMQLCAVLQGALAGEFAGFSSADSDPSRTLRVKAAITGVDRSLPLLNLLTALALFVPVDNGGVSIEVEAVDESTGRRIAALSGARNGSPGDLLGFFSRYGHAETGLKLLAQEFGRLVSAGVVPVGRTARN